jgi:hypothetical protein
MKSFDARAIVFKTLPVLGFCGLLCTLRPSLELSPTWLRQWWFSVPQIFAELANTRVWEDDVEWTSTQL